MSADPPHVVAVAASPTHGFSKAPRALIRLIEGIGVDGDAHAGVTVKHRSRVAVDPTQPNLRQVHLLGEEMLAELRASGFFVEPGSIGENILTRGLDLAALPRGSLLRIGPDALVEVMGLRNPCAQLDAFQAGLTAAVLDRDEDGSLIRKAGIMAVVRRSGDVKPFDPIGVDLPPPPHAKLDRV